MRGIYQNYDQRLDKTNFFNHKRKMKKSWYDGSTGLDPLDHAINNAKNYGWSHHIESPLVGISVGISLLAITTLAATAGAAFPLVFDRMGLDPALMSTPFITTCTDVAGTLIYLKTAEWLLENLPMLWQAASISTQFLAAVSF